MAEEGRRQYTETRITPVPQVIVELMPGLTPERADIEIRYFDIPGGWPVVVQMLVAAIGPALQKAFAQMQQPQGGSPIILASDLREIKH